MGMDRRACGDASARLCGQSSAGARMKVTMCETPTDPLTTERTFQGLTRYPIGRKAASLRSPFLWLAVYGYAFSGTRSSVEVNLPSKLRRTRLSQSQG